MNRQCDKCSKLINNINEPLFRDNDKNICYSCSLESKLVFYV